MKTAGNFLYASTSVVNSEYSLWRIQKDSAALVSTVKPQETYQSNQLFSYNDKIIMTNKSSWRNAYYMRHYAYGDTGVSYLRDTSNRVILIQEFEPGKDYMAITTDHLKKGIELLIVDDLNKAKNYQNYDLVPGYKGSDIRELSWKENSLFFRMTQNDSQKIMRVDPALDAITQIKGLSNYINVHSNIFRPTWFRISDSATILQMVSNDKKNTTKFKILGDTVEPFFDYNDSGLLGSRPFDEFFYKNELYFYINDAKLGFTIWKSDTLLSSATFFRELIPVTKGFTESSYFPKDNFVILSNQFYTNVGVPTIYNLGKSVDFLKVWEVDKSFWGFDVGSMVDDPARNRMYMVLSGSGSSTQNKLVYWDYENSTLTDLGLQLGSYKLIRNLNLINDKLFFTIYSYPHERLWVYDAKTSSSYEADIIRDDLRQTNAGDFCKVGNRLFYSAYFEDYRDGMFVSDGTAKGSYKIPQKDLGNSYYSPREFDQFASFKDSFVLFEATFDKEGSGLAISDGTESGTKLLKEIYVGSSRQDIRNITPGNGKALFVATTKNEGSELWVTDGTSNGTMLLKDIVPGSDGSSVNRLYFNAISNRWYFSAKDDKLGLHALWVSDGTINGTYSLGFKEIRTPREMVATESGLYVTGFDTNNMEELFFYNERDSSLIQIPSTNEYGASSPKKLTLYKGILYYGSYSFKHGREPHYLYTECVLGDINVPLKSCTGEEVVFSSTLKPNSSSPNYSWDFGDGGKSNKSNSTHVYNKAGEYQVGFEINDGSSCKREFLRTISIGETPTTGDILGVSTTENSRDTFTSSTVLNDGRRYEWSVHLGKVVEGQGTNRAIIEWYTGPTEATVMLKEIGSSDCEGELESLKVKVNRTISIEEVEFKNGFDLYPNPTNGKINLVFQDKNQNGKLTIYNTVGIQVYSADFHTKTPFEDDLELPSGVYFAKVKVNQETAVVKLVVD